MNQDQAHRGPSDQRVAELIIAHARDYAIFTLDRTGMIISWTKAAERITGYSADEAIGVDFGILFTASDLAAGDDRRELETAWATGRAEDSRWHVRKDGRRFWANGVTTAFRDDGSEGLIKVIRDETPARLAEEQRVLLLNELNHRINNTLVTVQSLVEQTLRSTDVDRQIREDLASRLVALSEAHKLLVEQNWAGADLQVIVDRTIAPHQGGDPPRLRSEGPPMLLSPKQAVAMALVLHELTTNAVKYGALSTASGYVRLSWNLHHDGDGARHMTFLWTEHDGPAVAEPLRRGFGTRLIAKSFGSETDGSAQMSFAPEGVRCSISLALSAATEQPILDLHGEA
jgi:PAS domain S-box-containing protein